jgi:hypothetical protein
MSVNPIHEQRKLQATINALVAQRDSALTDAIRLAGEVEYWRGIAQEAQAEVATLRAPPATAPAAPAPATASAA